MSMFLSAFATPALSSGFKSGNGIVAAILAAIRPSLIGRPRTSSVTTLPEKNVSAPPVKRTPSNIMMLNRMASELDTQQPNLAAELRLLAAKG